jgi:hypothetical protein
VTQPPRLCNSLLAYILFNRFVGRSIITKKYTRLMAGMERRSDSPAFYFLLYFCFIFAFVHWSTRFLSPALKMKRRDTADIQHGKGAEIGGTKTEPEH